MIYDNEPWIEHNGSPVCPVDPPHTPTQILMRADYAPGKLEKSGHAMSANSWIWEWADMDGDLVAYRVPEEGAP